LNDHARPRAFVTAPLRGPGFDKLQQLLDIVYEPWLEFQPIRLLDGDKIAARLDELDAEILICESDFVGGPVMDRPLRLIACTRGDPNNIDVAAATKSSIPVTRCPGRNADAVAELAVALLFAANRHVIAGDDDVRAGEVYKDGSIPYQRFRAWELQGKTAGLVGLGAVAKALKWRLEGLGLKVIAFDPYNPEAEHSLDDLLAESDIVSMHAPVTPDTTGMIGADQFARMRDGVIYLNTARAQLHDTDALVAALQSGKILSAGLDHFVGENLPTDHPLVSMPNVVLTPHIGGATYDVEVRQAEMVAADVERLLAGQPLQYIVNPEVQS
jgi:D-3-phosphoglycerate dehydrogenase